VLQGRRKEEEETQVERARCVKRVNGKGREKGRREKGKEEKEKLESKEQEKVEKRQAWSGTG
jgi:hypothetical protein